MRNLAWMELRLARREEARALYERAITSGDFAARMLFAQTMARGRFGLRAIPAGLRSLRTAVREFSAKVDAKGDEPSAAPSQPVQPQIVLTSALH